MSKKDEIISDLREEISKLKIRLYVTEYVNDKFTRAHEQSLKSAREDPILTLPSGKQIAFRSLTQKQLEYLESLALELKLKDTSIKR